MSNGEVKRMVRGAALAGATLLCAPYAVANDHGHTLMTADTIMREMQADERFLFVTGILEGLAYARLEKDTEAAGQRDNSGMNCIYDWFYQSDGRTFQLIQAAFDRYPEHFPNTIVAVLINRECGE
ncbi:MAG: hypothetical protein AAF234_13540 [Pseudomonadota bacterium]